MLIYLILFAFGLMVGSFLAVVVYRETKDIEKNIDGQRTFLDFLPSWVKGRSYCDFCHKQLSWYENIPLLSFLIQKGKCRKCGKAIPSNYFLIELLTGLEFVWIYWLIQRLIFFEQLEGMHSFLVLGFWLFIFSLSFALALIDFKTQILPDSLIIVGVGVSLLRLFITGRWEFILSALGLFLFYLFLYLITQGKGIGFGDVKLGLFVGLTVGWWQWTIVATFLAFLLGSLVGVILIIAKKKQMKSAIAFGPFMLLGMLIAKISGEFLWNSYLGLIGF
ncbi:prepilin peptidase [Candidatus Beckwithbacteria bacterium]|nr:prepilin peptidase [Candidatus Beckwithbacteria bacterium]